MGFSSRILLDSVSPAGARLTTMEVTFPRFVLAEFNTHRMFCLDGGTRLDFYAPTDSSERNRRSHMTMWELYARWHGGSARPKNRIARMHKTIAGSRDYAGVDVVSFDAAPSAERERLAALNLRSCNEDTGHMYGTRVTGVCYSGEKHIFRVCLADGRAILSSKDHLFFTRSGWERLEDAVGLELSVRGTALVRRTAELAVDNDAALCAFSEVQSVEYVGVRDAYDIEVEGPYHNFVADGFIVHNSRNSASSRAIPTAKLIERVKSEPAIPVEWGRNKKGMSAEHAIDVAEQTEALAAWLAARDDAVEHASRFNELKVHKQIANRVLEPFMWHTVIVSATEWDNFFALRRSPNAQPEIHVAADLMRAAYEHSIPRTLASDEWHMPLLQDDERSLPLDQQKKLSVARCARVSYLTHDGTRDIAADLELFTRLRDDRHLSPFEHVATPTVDAEFHANFRGWIQMRRQIESELSEYGAPIAEARA